MTEKEPADKMTTTQRIALGLSPVGTPSTTSRVPTTTETQKMMTQRMAVATGMTTKMQAVGYRPGMATQRQEAVKVGTRRRWWMWAAAAGAVVPVLVIVLGLTGGDKDVIERSTDDFRKNIVGEVNASATLPPLTDPSANPAAGPGDPAVPAPPAPVPIRRDSAGQEIPWHPANWDEEGQVPIYVNKQLQYETENVQVQFAKPYVAPKREEPEIPAAGVDAGAESMTEQIDPSRR